MYKRQIEYRLLSAKEIQQKVLGEGTVLKETLEADYDSDETPESNEEGTVIYEFGNPSYSMVAEQQTEYSAQPQEMCIRDSQFTRESVILTSKVFL